MLNNIIIYISNNKELLIFLLLIASIFKCSMFLFRKYKNNAVCSILAKLLIMKICIIIPHILAFKIANSVDAFVKMCILISLIQVTFIFFYKYLESPIKTMSITLISILASQTVMLIFAHSLKHIDIAILIALGFLIILLISYKLFKAKSVKQLLININFPDIIISAVSCALMLVILRMLILLIAPASHAFLFMPMPLPIQAVSDISVTGPFILLMGNKGSRGVGVIGSAINNHTTGVSNTTNYSNNYIKEIRRQLFICEMIDSEFKKQSPRRSIFPHMWVVNDEKTKANTLTTTTYNAVLVEKEIVKPNPEYPDAQQYMRKETFDVNPTVIKEHTKRSQEMDNYAIKHKEKLEEAQKKCFSSGLKQESFETQYEKEKNRQNEKK